MVGTASWLWIEFFPPTIQAFFFGEEIYYKNYYKILWFELAMHFQRENNEFAAINNSIKNLQDFLYDGLVFAFGNCKKKIEAFVSEMKKIRA